MIDGPPGGVTIAGEMAAVLQVTVNQPGTYTFQIAESSGSCVGYDTITVDITGGPDDIEVTTDCDVDGNYTVTLEIDGGVQPYDVNGDVIVGTTFVSDPIPSGGSYNFIVTDANGCSSEVSGDFICPCLSVAGTMDGTLLELCAATDEEAVASIPSDAVLDSDDAGVFILHTGSGNALGTIIETNSTGVFTFQPGMVYGQTYYISYVVGNAQGGSVNLSDPCLAVAAGQPVIFYDAPTVTYNGPDQFCETSFELTLDISGDVTQSTWTQTAGPGMATITNATASTASVTVSDPGVYQFEVTSSNGFCQTSTSFDIEVGGALSVVNINEVCSTPDEFVLTFGINGGVEPLTANIAGTFNGNAFTSGTLLTANSYDITVTDAAGCTVQFSIGPVQCDCESEAGDMSVDIIELCEGDDVITIDFLGGQILDADDIERFVIHTGAGSIIENLILETSDETILLPLMLLQTGTVYYVSHVVGATR